MASVPTALALADLVARDATEADLEALFRLHEETMRTLVDATYGSWDDADQRRRFRESFVSHPPCVLVRKGDLGIVAAYRIDRSSSEHFLSIVEVAADAQGRGIGSAIVRRFVDDARLAGAEATLQVMKVNPRARQLYERLGFVVVGETPTHDRMRALRAPPATDRPCTDGTRR